MDIEPTPDSPLLSSAPLASAGPTDPASPDDAPPSTAAGGAREAAAIVWARLLDDGRRKAVARASAGVAEGGDDEGRAIPEVRTEIERDGDRLVFATPFRRLMDKTQVFPLEQHDSVRTRLTHSYGVANLARSIGVDLAFRRHDVFGGAALGLPRIQRDLPALLFAVSLAHDLGNPPFGHQGEFAIQRWFARNKQEVFGGQDLTPAMRADFLKFEGNAQTFRLLTRLQLVEHAYGMDLTHATLAALMKYPCASDQVEKAAGASRKKHGYFQSEREIASDVRARVGLPGFRRHPLTYVMEACDDIAYSVLDAEDAVKKNLASFPDLIAALEHDASASAGAGDPVIDRVVRRARAKHAQFRQLSLSPGELNDVSMQRFRVFAISEMVHAVTETFLAVLPRMLTGEFDDPLIDVGAAAALTRALKRFDRDVAYRHRSVLRVELRGAQVIEGLLDRLWRAVTDRAEPSNPASPRRHPLTSYTYGRISENYRRVFEAAGPSLPLRYRECQLITDMVAGMTDSYAVALHEELLAAEGAARA